MDELNIISSMPLKAYDILDIKVTLNPLKLSKYLTDSGLLLRLNRFCMNAAEMTEDEISDPAYNDFTALFIKLFFDFDYKPANEPSGIDNLAEILNGSIQEDINWNIFIRDKLKGKNPDKQLEIYNEIRMAGMIIYEDYFRELKRLRISNNLNIN